MQTSLESIVQDFYCMHQLDPLKWTAYYSGVTICHEYRYGYIYMYSWIIKMRTFFVIGDWFIQSYKYIILNSILFSQLLFFRYFACLQSTLRRCIFRQNCLIMQSFLSSLAVPSNHQSVHLFYALIPSYFTPSAEFQVRTLCCRQSKRPFNDDSIPYD